MNAVKTFKVPRFYFNHQIRQGVKVNECALCGQSPKITVNYPLYGRTGAEVVCRCGNASKIQSISTVMFCGASIGTPITYKSISRGIEKAVKVWNIDNPPRAYLDRLAGR